MYEIDPSKPMPELEISSMDSTNILKILDLRLRCRNEKKTGAIYAGFGRMYHIDTEGNYVGEKPPQEIELERLLAQFVL